MKICFPVRKQNGSEYTTLDEMMGLIGREPHGSHWRVLTAYGMAEFTSVPYLPPVRY